MRATLLFAVIGIGCSGVQYEQTGTLGAVEVTGGPGRRLAGDLLVYADDPHDAASLVAGAADLQPWVPLAIGVTSDADLFESSTVLERWSLVRLPIGAAGCDQGPLCEPISPGSDKALLACVVAREKLILAGECIGPGSAVLKHELGHVVGAKHAHTGLMADGTRDFRVSHETSLELQLLYR